MDRALAELLRAEPGMKRRRELPYWLSGGGKICLVCEHPFVVEAGFHCSACDRPVCGECVLVDAATGEVLCVACGEVGAGGE